MMEILQIIEEYYQIKKQLNILISGPTCSGKSTLGEEINNYFGNASLVQQDWYFKDLNQIPKTNNGYLMDSVNAFEQSEFISDVNYLLKNGFCLVPNYLIEINKRKNKSKKIYLQSINIIEGLHVINTFEEIENKITIYLDTSLDECLRRRIARDQQFLNISKDRIEQYFSKCMIPMYEYYIKSQKEKADIILNEEGVIKCSLKK